MGLIDPKFLANPERIAWRTMARILPPPPPVDYVKWAVQNVRFKKGQTDDRFIGPYNPDLFPFYSRVFDVLNPEHPTKVVVLMKSAQIGGTVLANVFVAGSLDLDPSPILYTHPTDSNASRWVKLKWRPMLREMPRVMALFPKGTSKEGGNSLDFQERIDGLGSLTVSGANSGADLSMISMLRQVQDDLSKWELNNAGDPETQADSRSMSFQWAKIFKVSTPLVKDNCRITKAYNASTRERWHVPCPQCGTKFPLTVENFLENFDRKEGDPPVDLDNLVFNCPDCGGILTEQQYHTVKARGEWVAQNPGASTVGFYLWAAYPGIVTWREIAEKWLAAKGDPGVEKVVYNDWFGLAYESAGDAPDWEKLRDRAEASGLVRGVIPRGALILCIGVDCQDDRVEWHLIGFGRDAKRWVIDYGVIDGHVSEAATRENLNALLRREWRDTFAKKRKADGLAIDGNAFTTDVFDWVKVHPSSRVIMVRGAKSDAAPPLALVKYERKKDGKTAKWSRRFFNVGVSGMKSALYICLKKPDPQERGYVAIPAGFDDDYFEQITSERRAEVKKRGGAREFRWVLPPGKRNEVLDTANYAEAMAMRLGWKKNTDEDWDRLEALIEVFPPEAQPDLEDLLLAPPAAKPASEPKPATPAKPGRRLA